MHVSCLFLCLLLSILSLFPSWARMPGSEGSGLVDLYPAPAYAGVPIRERTSRPAIAKAHRRSTETQSHANKENMKVQAKALRDKFNQDIAQLAEKSSLPRSTVASEAYKRGRRLIHRRAINSFNAWIAMRYEELTSREFPSFLKYIRN